jgi:hypothetical protein
MSQPFIPQNKPKSWVVFVCAGLIGLLCFGPFMLLAHFLEITPLLYIGKTGFFMCVAAMFLTWPVFIFGLLTGKYKDIPARTWKEQVW